MKNIVKAKKIFTSSVLLVIFVSSVTVNFGALLLNGNIFKNIKKLKNSFYGFERLAAELLHIK